MTMMSHNFNNFCVIFTARVYILTMPAKKIKKNIKSEVLSNTPVYKALIFILHHATSSPFLIRDGET